MQLSGNPTHRDLGLGYLFHRACRHSGYLPSILNFSVSRAHQSDNCFGFNFNNFCFPRPFPVKRLVTLWRLTAAFWCRMSLVCSTHVALPVTVSLSTRGHSSCAG